MTSWEPGQPVFPNEGWDRDCFHRPLFSILNPHNSEACGLCAGYEDMPHDAMRWAPEVLTYEYPGCGHCGGSHSPAEFVHVQDADEDALLEVVPF